MLACILGTLSKEHLWRTQQQDQKDLLKGVRDKSEILTQKRQAT